MDGLELLVIAITVNTEVSMCKRLSAELAGAALYIVLLECANPPPSMYFMLENCTLF